MVHEGQLFELSQDSDVLLSYPVDAAERRGTRPSAVHVWRGPAPEGPTAACTGGTGDHLACVIRLPCPWRDKPPDLTIEEEAVHGHTAYGLIELLVADRRAHDHPWSPHRPRDAHRAAPRPVPGGGGACRVRSAPVG